MQKLTGDFKAIYAATEKFRDLRMHHWVHHDLFSIVWWLLVAITIGPWIAWWKLADKRRLLELVCFGALTTALCLILDAMGTVNLWWMYYAELIIQYPGLLVADISDIPVVYMLVHQYCSTWKSFIIAMLVVSGVFAYVIEPSFRLLNIYAPLTWEHFVSFLVYLAMAILTRWSILKIKKLAFTP